MSPQEHLKAWREREGLSMAAAAERLGLSSASSYAYYESEAYTRDYLPAQFAMLTGQPSGAKPPFSNTSPLKALQAIAALATREAHEATDMHYAIIFSGIAATANAAVNPHRTQQPNGSAPEPHPND